MADAPGNVTDLWSPLRAATSARVGLGRSGDAQPLRAVLEFQQAHAKARDAVHLPLDVDALTAELGPHRVVQVESAAADRSTYLRRPDLGRRLDEASAEALDAEEKGFDVVFVIGDGLSATAVQTHAAALLHAAVERLGGLSVGPVVVARQARVALGDEVGERLKAKLVAVLIGERPGLSVAESLGVYLTFDPRRGRRDSERNCISNVHRLGGLSYALAADKLAWLAREALRLGLTGVKLKDDVDLLAAAAGSPALEGG
ncbi:ethanolamine ammonia-lyase subunit EutC [Methylopila turkensis]|uniref:Ethanolamine ammonia-lyase small subunit n=1 Tax=Methylopila turkensis TaxID=1437816 RepID=A0A9W6N5V5_9HYPH|nr:ethanolamine ammonia-lyase subunit EutC [Methylopila turkensis]GLK78778.1 ethanolamine ammonia-lyase light chain [Methylopila turkensis]